MNAFSNPYPCAKYEVDDPDKRTCRLQSRILQKDHDYIYNLRMSKGTTTTTVNILWKKLVDACREMGLVDMNDRVAFENFVINSQLVLIAKPNDKSKRSTKNRKPAVSRRSNSGSTRNSKPSDDGRAVNGAHTEIAGTPDQQSVHASGNAQGNADERPEG